MSQALRLADSYQCSSSSKRPDTLYSWRYAFADARVNAQTCAYLHTKVCIPIPMRIPMHVCLSTHVHSPTHKYIHELN